MNHFSTDSMKILGAMSPIPRVFPEEERRGVYQAIYSRRDIRHFRSQPIPQGLVGAPAGQRAIPTGTPGGGLLL
jgi:hypothetical protein